MIGFTLMELLISVSIVGILVAVAVPQYGRAVERANWRSAMDSLQTLYAGEQVFQSLSANRNYIDPATTACPPLVAVAPAWGCVYMDDPNRPGFPVAFAIAVNNGVNPRTFTATATRVGGPCGDWTRTMDQAKGGTWNNPTPC